MTLPPGIPPAAVGLVTRLLEDPPVSHATLLSLLTEHVADINALAADKEGLDTSLALKLAELCSALLDEADRSGSDETHRLVQAAVNYFILNEDGDPDLESPHGLDDDAQVCNAIAKHLGRDDLVIPSST